MSDIINGLLKIYGDKNLSLENISSFLIKIIALKGNKEDFELLPKEIQEAIIASINKYNKNQKWIVISNLGEEDYAPYAIQFIEKVK